MRDSMWELFVRAFGIGDESSTATTAHPIEAPCGAALAMPLAETVAQLVRPTLEELRESLLGLLRLLAADVLERSDASTTGRLA